MTFSTFFRTMFVSLMFVASAGLSAVIESLTHFAATTTTPELLLIGDVHGEVDNKNDALHRDLLLKCIEGWAKSDEYILVLLEASEYTYKRYINAILPQAKKAYGNAFHVETLYALPIYAHKFPSLTDGKIAFSLSDIRGPGVTTLGDFFTVFDSPMILQLLAQSVGSSARNIFALNNFLQHDSRSKEQFFKSNMLKVVVDQARKTVSSISAKDCLAEIEKNLASVKKFRDTLSASSSEYKVMEDFYVKIARGRDCAQKFFAQHLSNLNKPCVDALSNVLYEKQSFAAFFNELQEWVQPLFEAVADAGFTILVIKNQKRFNKIVLFAGNNHAIVVKDALLQGFGYPTPVLAKGLQETTTAFAYHGPKFNVPELRKLLKTVFAQRAFALNQNGSSSVCASSASSSGEAKAAPVASSSVAASSASSSSASCASCSSQASVSAASQAIDVKVAARA